MADNGRPLFERGAYGVVPPPGTPKLSPFGEPRGNPFDAVLATEPEVVEGIRHAYESAVPVLFPRHLSAPEGARTVDLRKSAIVVAAGNIELFRFVCAPGTSTVFFGYALSTDAAPFSAIVWRPSINKSRVLEYHGDPSNNFEINFAPGTSLSQENLIPCQILMQPNDVLIWRLANNTGTPVTMGVRMVGYLDMSQRLTSSKFGD